MGQPFDVDDFRARPLYYDTRDLVEDWGDALNALIGQKIHAVHAQWEAEDLSDRGWWNNGLVLFTFENARLDLLGSKGGFGVAVDSFKVNFDDADGESDEDSIHVIWRNNPWTPLGRCLQQPLLGLKAIEATADDSNEPPRFMGLTFRFEAATICLYEGGDQLALTWGSLPDDRSLLWHEGLEFGTP